MRVMFLAAEAVPFFKVGGLGDVVGSLPRALQALEPDWDIRLVLPLHDHLDRERFPLEPVAAFTVPHRNGPILAEAYTTAWDLPVYFISGAPILLESSVYAAHPSQDGPKYAYFSLAALELARTLGWMPDVLHAHDWHTAPAVYAVALRREHAPFWAHTRTVLTVHNLPYMGQGAGPALQAFGLPPAPDDSGLPEWARVLPLPLGLWAADAITTVSPTYAREILTPEHGCGLEAFLRARADRLTGILNGLDTTSWDPAQDPEVPHPFSPEDLSPREENRQALRDEVGLPHPAGRVPILGAVSRLTEQKGMDLLPAALSRLEAYPWQAVLLGAGDEEIATAWQALDKRYPERVKVILGYNPGLARRIYAGADMLLIPSRYEPCGLVQMMAMRYGCVPVAHETGGLADTVLDYNLAPRRSTGFLFPEATAKSLAFALRRAFAVFADPRRWRALQRRGMRRDFSWQASARAYAQLYRALAR
ncbi:MAG TPA: glycogen synthase [Anaerolineales bacterium]|nr:glycogen synthase [Anaerolineales bacterium]